MDVFEKDYDGKTALFDANYSDTKLLLKAGINPNITDSFGNNALTYVKDFKIAKLLIDYGSNLKRLIKCSKGTCDQIRSYYDVINAEGFVYEFSRSRRFSSDNDDKKAKRQKYQKEYKQQNAEKIKKQQKSYQRGEQRKSYQKEYKQQNAEKIKEYNKKSYERTRLKKLEKIGLEALLSLSKHT